MRGGLVHSKDLSGFKNMSMQDVEILRLLCQEKTTKEIASDLGCSDRNIQSHRAKLMLRTDSKSMVGLVKYSIKNKIYEI